MLKFGPEGGLPRRMQGLPGAGKPAFPYPANLWLGNNGNLLPGALKERWFFSLYW